MVRIKHRYILLNFLYPNPAKQTAPKGKQDDESLPWTVQFHRPSSDWLDMKLLHRMIRDGISDLFGNYGAGMVMGSLQIKYLSAATSTAIVRVAREHYRMVWAALSFITRVPKPIDESCVVQVVRVSGTVRKAEEEAVRRARLGIVRAQRARVVRKEDGGDDADDGWGMVDGVEDDDGEEDGESDDDH